MDKEDVEKKIKKIKDKYRELCNKDLDNSDIDKDAFSALTKEYIRLIKNETETKE